jgi:hypothetical protein
VPRPVFVADRGPNYSRSPGTSCAKAGSALLTTLTVSVYMFPNYGTEMPFTGRVGNSHLMIGAQMPFTPIKPADVTHFTASRDSGLSCTSPRADSETTAPAAEEVSSPTVITEHEVMLGTAAALAPAHSFEGEDAAGVVAVGRGGSGWIAALARLVTPSPDRRPPRQHYPPRLDFTEHARMAREMYRL